MKSQNQLLSSLSKNLARVIHGKSDAIDLLIIALLAEGSVLVEDAPGLGKTTLAKALARSSHLQFRRVQFTPDLLPADILGSSVYNPLTGAFDFRPGPVFTNILLADEINRGSPRTQSALLEAMNEGQATVEGVTHTLPQPFLVIATQNPIEHHGTYPLPEAELDRFCMRIALGYPDGETEIQIVQSRLVADPLTDLQAVLDVEQVRSLQQQARRVRAAPAVWEYLVQLVGQTRVDERVALGASPRGSLMLARAAQGAAFLAGRDYCTPDDIQRMASPVLAHRIILNGQAQYDGTTGESVVADAVDRVAVPT